MDAARGGRRGPGGRCAGLAIVGATSALAGFVAIRRRYRRDVERAWSRLAGVDRHIVATRFGAVEFTVAGDGPPLLVSHGIFHGCDGGLLAVRDIVDGRRVIVPSRFGYLGSALPDDATCADQADAFAALLDHLGIETTDVIGISAGTGAAVELALRHPHRVAHLVVSSGNWPGNPTATQPPAWAKAFYSDPAMWSLKRCGGRVMGRLMGVPSGFPRNAAQRRDVDELCDSIFPIAPRVDGAIFDAFVSNPQIAECELDAVAVPTLVVHAVDDPLASFDAAAAAAQRIPGAVLVALESGGHLGLGQNGRVRAELAAFLER
jgi:pimeloyl-ACP methyl ester carboxylesterase